MAKRADVFELLKKDHKEARTQLQAIIADCKKDAVDFAKVEKVRDALELHMMLEEKFLYPKAEKEKNASDLTEHSYDEHQEVKDLLKDLDEEVEASELSEVLTEVLEKIEHHVQEEETKLFPTLEKDWDQDKIEKLGQEIAQAKEKELARQ